MPLTFALLTLLVIQMQATRTLIQDNFNIPAQPWSDVCEAAPGQKSYDENLYCARMEGPAFLVNASSRNKRFYPRPLWDKTIQEAQPRFEDGGLFGTISHEQALDDKAILEGKITHKVTRLWIDEAQQIGKCEILILNNESGQNLALLLRAGMPLSVSSRAYGAAKGRTSEGHEIIDPDNYFLETFDFVRVPGVPGARPLIVESHNEVNTNMDEQARTKELQAENFELQKKLQNESLSLLAAQASIKELTEKVAHVEQEANEGIRKHLELEPFRSLAKETGLLDQNDTTFGQKYKAVLQVAESYAKLGDPKSINEAMDKLKKYEELGTVREIDECLNLLEAFGQICPGRKPDEVKAIVERAEKILASVEASKRKIAANEVATKHGVDEAAVTKLFEAGIAKDDVEAMVEALKAPSKNMASRYQSQAPAAKGELPTPKAESTLGSLFESFSYDGTVTSVPSPKL